MIPDYFPAFGIRCETREELVSFCHRVIQNGTAIQVPDSDLRLIRREVNEGVHIWMYANPANEVESLYPFYYPVATHELDVNRLLQGEGQPASPQVEARVPKENMTSSETEPEGSTVRAGENATSEDVSGYKLSFICVDAPLYVEELQGKGSRPFQLMGVCRKPKIYVDREAFDREQRDWGMGMNIQPRTVLSSDMLNIDVESIFQEGSVHPYVYMTGFVRDVFVRSGERTDTPFIHLKLDTSGMDLDVLLGQNAVPTTPEPGNVLEGHFLLLGMMKPRGG